MKLEKVDVDKLHIEDLPRFDKCPCELCDDGCFDHSGYQHHPECRRKPVQRTDLPLTLRCPLSHYKATFQAATTVSGRAADHRRKPCSPAPDNEIPISFKNVPISGLSSQRDHYQPPPANSITKSSTMHTKQDDSLSLRRALPMATQSHYQAEYVQKPVIPIPLRPLKDSTKDSDIYLTEPTMSISSQTTTRSHFKPWQSARARPYAESPAVVGHVLFPGSSRHFSTSTGSTFVSYPKGSKAKPIPRLESSGNLRVSGSMDFRTNYRESFIPQESSLLSQSAPTERQSKLNEEKVYTRRPMYSISQTRFDFRPYPKHQRTEPAGMESFVSQIPLGNSFTPAITKSQYRVDYEGIDTSRYPRQAAAAPKDHQKPYVAPIQKMDTMTVTQKDFQPIDFTSLPRIRLIPLKATLSLDDQHAPMENVSMSRHHYQPYEFKKFRRQYGDPVPDVYIPPLDKFQGSTTTGETYRGEPGRRARAYVPEIRMANRVGKHDLNTNYRVDYHPHGLTLCAAKAYAIAQNKLNPATPISAQ